MLRRSFLQSAAAAALVACNNNQADASAPVPIQLGFDTYSLRSFHWKAIQLLDYAAGLKLDTIQISSLGDYESLEPLYLAKVKEHATRVQVSIDGGIGCICPLSKSWNATQGTPADYIMRGLRVAKAVGAKSMRCFMGSSADRTGAHPIEPLMEKTIQVFRSVRSQAMDTGVKIALENHAGDMQAGEVKTIIEESGKDLVASCLDTGNPMWVAEDPQVSLEVLGPYVVTTHIRDSVLYEDPRGAAAQWVALGDGTIDFAKFMARYRELCPQASMQLEVITGRPPRVVPYLESNFWKAFPKANAAEFARFVALAKRGRAFNGFMVIEDGAADSPAEFKAALRQQQRVDLERSIEYAKHKLGAGVRWQS